MPLRPPMDTTYTQVWDAMTNAVSEKTIVRDVDGAFIPFDEGNMDYIDYLWWLDAGNEPNPPQGNPTPPIGETPPPDIHEVNAQVQDIDARLSALEDEIAGRR